MIELKYNIISLMSDFIRNRKLSNLTFSQNWNEKKGSKGQEKKKFFTEASE